MDCASCGKVNRAAARFCSGCGSALAPRCPSCGAEHEPGARFCDACGATLVAAEGPRGTASTTDTETRRVVTLVFADLIGSTTLHERIDAESARRVMARYYAALSGAVETHDGTVIKLLGDGVLAGFGVARVQEDDAVRAVRAAVAMHDAMAGLTSEFAELAGELGLRVGVNTGEVVVSDMDDDVVGDPVNVAARLQQEARDGEVLIGDATRRLVGDVLTVEPAGEFALKGRTGTVAAHRVVSLERPATGPTTSFVGRDDELRRVLASYTTATIEREARFVIMVGSPGLGKSRLMDEVSRRLVGEASILTARCDVSGGPTFTPIADAIRAFVVVDSDDPSVDSVRAAFEALIDDDEAERDRIVKGAVGLCAGTPGPPEETFWVVRRVLAALGQQRPVVLTIDDLHWAEPLLLDLVEHLVEWSTDVPLLVLGAARPELRDTRSSLTTAGGGADVVLALDGLDAGAATRLAADAIGAAELPAAVAGRVLAASEGNPLFLGALVRMLVEDGALEWDGDRWVATVELDELQMPPTIHALLAARIDRLEPVVRLVLERASVIGRQFSREAVAYLLPPELQTELDSALETLRRSELVEPDDAWFLGEPALRFHHALIRDAAYRRLLKDARADLHASFAGWLEQRVGEGTEQDETIGLHFEQAYRHRGQLGPLDERARSLGMRAAERLAAEGRRALSRDDLTVAAGLLGRAVALLEPTDPQRADLSLDWCEALLAGGDVNEAPNAIAELDRWTEASQRMQAWRISFAGHLAVLTDPERLRETADAVAAAAATLSALDDAAGEAKAHSVRALALARLGEVGACENALDQALVAARRADDRRRSNAVLAGAPVAALWGPSPVTRASGRCLDVVRVLRITAAAPAVEAVAMRCQAVLEALRGRGDAARRMIASSRRTVEELGLTIRILEADMAAGLIELVNGDPGAAETLLRRTYAGFRDRGLGVDAAQAGALLGRSLLALGRVSEAEAISHECEELAGHDLKAAIAWRGVRAESLARRGQYTAAIGFARDAVAIAADTDALLDHADARVALAVALRVAGKHTEAEAETNAAIDLWSAKGATALLADASESEPQANTTAPDLVQPNRATQNADRMDAAVAARDLEAVSATLAPDFENWYRPLHTTGGRDEVIESWRLVFTDANASVERRDLATRGENLALFHSVLTIHTTDNDRFSAATLEYLVLIEVDDQGRRRWGEVFDPDDTDHALARLDERADRLPDPASGRAETTAERNSSSNFAFTALLTSERRWREGDWDGVLTVYDADQYVLDDRRSLMHMRASGDEFVENLRFLFDDGAFTSTFVEGRGDRLALVKAEYRSARKDAFFSEHYCVAETDADGRLIAMVIFDLADLDSATAELEARFTKRQSLREFGHNSAVRVLIRVGEALEARDLDEVENLLAPEFRAISHRSLFQHDSNRETHLVFLRVMTEVESFTTAISVIATRRDRLAMTRLAFRGADRSVDLGASDIEWLQVTEVDDQGHCTLMVSFDLDDLDGAYAELERLYDEGEGDRPADDRTTASPVSMPRNAATRASDRNFTAFEAADWTALEALTAPNFTFRDHRNGMHTEFATRQWIESMELMSTSNARAERRQLAALGEQVALERVRWTGRSTEPEAEGAEFEVEILRVVQADDEDRIVVASIYDGDDRRAATDELWRLYEQTEDGQRAPAVIFENRRAFNGHDLAAMRATLRDDFVCNDHRLTGGGELGVDAYLESAATMFEATRDLVSETLYFDATNEWGNISVAGMTGTSAQGGEFEIVFLRLSMTDGELLTAIELFEVGDLELARARFDALSREVDERNVAGGHLRGKAATAAMSRTAVVDVLEQLGHAFDAKDWDRFEALSSPSMVMDDRRRLSQVRGDLSTWVESSKLLAEAGAVEESTHLSMLGENLVLDRVLWSHRGETSGYEVEALRVCQLDDEGCLAAAIVFDPDDRRAANEELWRLYERSDEGKTTPTSIFRNLEAFNHHDLDALRATLRDDFVFDDRRRTGSGALGADAYVESVAALLGETDDLIGETLYRVATNAWGTLSVGHIVGTTSHGGDFENLFVRLIMTDGDLLTRIEIFEHDDLGLAKARFDELRAADLADLRNLATATMDRWETAFLAEDVDTLMSLTAEETVFDDRRSMTHVVGGRDALERSITQILEFGGTMERTVLAVLGERLALERALWTGWSAGTEFTAEILSVNEVDGSGLLTAVVTFDADDRNAAHDELWSRFDAIGEGPFRAPVRDAARRAFNRHDLEGLRSALHDDFVFEDHRKTSIGFLTADEYVESVAALGDESQTFSNETVCLITQRGWGGVDLARVVGTIRDGAPFENLFVRCVVSDGSKITAIAIFEPEEVDRAVSRLGELRPANDESSVIPSNAATRALDRTEAFYEARRWDELEAAVSPDLVVEDRRALARVTADRAAWLESSRLLAEVNATQRRIPLSVLGETLAMHASSWSAEADGAFIDGEAIAVAEADAAGRLVAVLYFDSSDRLAANEELWDRFRASADGGLLPQVVFDAAHTVNRGDVDAFRALLDGDFVFADRRPLGSDALGPETYVEFFEALIAETSDYVYESVRILAMSPFGVVDGARLMGHTLDGATFERVFVRLILAVDGRLSTMEVFPVEDEDAALARFEELQAQHQPTVKFEDLEAFRSMLAEDCVLVDHRLLAAEPMDRDTYVDYFATLVEETSDVNYERLEVIEESSEGVIELDRLTGHTKDGVEFETLFLRVAMRRDGLFVVMEIFAPEDREAALARFEELQSMYVVDQPRNKATDALGRAQPLYEARDWEGLKALASPEFLFSDRRHLAHVTSDRDGWIHSSKLMASASAVEVRTILRAPGDRLALYQSLWTAQVEGAPYVVESLGLCEVDDDGRFVELLHFDLEQRSEAEDELLSRFRAHEALARVEELSDPE